MIKTHLVSVLYDNNGKCIFVAKCKNVGDIEYNKLLNESTSNYLKKESEIKQLENRVHKLELDIKLDRGEITQEEYEKELNNL